VSPTGSRLQISPICIRLPTCHTFQPTVTTDKTARYSRAEKISSEIPLLVLCDNQFDQFRF